MTPWPRGEARLPAFRPNQIIDLVTTDSTSSTKSQNFPPPFLSQHTFSLDFFCTLHLAHLESNYCVHDSNQSCETSSRAWGEPGGRNIREGKPNQHANSSHCGRNNHRRPPVSYRSESSTPLNSRRVRSTRRKKRFCCHSSRKLHHRTAHHIAHTPANSPARHSCLRPGTKVSQLLWLLSSFPDGHDSRFGGRAWESTCCRNKKLPPAWRQL